MLLVEDYNTKQKGNMGYRKSEWTGCQIEMANQVTNSERECENETPRRQQILIPSKHEQIGAVERAGLTY